MGRVGSVAILALATGVVGCSPAGTGELEAPAADVAASPADMLGIGLGETPDGLSARAEMVTVESQTGGAGVYVEPCVITAESIAGVTKPATLGAFAGAFPAGTSLVFEPLHMVDFGSLCLVVGGRDRVCTMFYEYEVDGWNPGAEALGLYTKDPSCRTAEGVGPGSAAADVEAVFGAPEFQFSYDNEGREYVDFADAPEALGFRVASDTAGMLVSGAAGRSTFWPNGDFGGDYREGGEDFVTHAALPDAVILEVSIY